MNLTTYRPGLHLSASPDELAYHGPEELPGILEEIPDGSELYGSLHTTVPVRIDVPVSKGRKRGVLTLCPSTVWGGEIEPEAALTEFERKFEWSRPTPGGCARRLVRESLRGLPLYGPNSIVADVELVRILSTSHFPGPISRQLSARIRGLACVVDQRAAYLAAMGRPLPYGRPYRWAGDVGYDGAWKGDGVVPDALCAVVGCPVLDPHRWHGCRLPDGLGHAYPDAYVYRGTWHELRRGVEAGRLRLAGGHARLEGWVWNASADRTLEGWIAPWLAEDPSTERGRVRRVLAKLVYTRGWVQHVYPGYRRGVACRDPGQIPDGYAPDPVRPWIVWGVSSIDPSVEPRIRSVLQRPERSAHVVAYLRDELLTLAGEVVRRGGTVGQLLVDAAIASKEHLPDLDYGDGIGQWRVEDADDFEGIPAIGEYAASSPGRYQIRDVETGRVLRERHSGLEEPLGWDELGTV